MSEDPYFAVIFTITGQPMTATCKDRLIVPLFLNRDDAEEAGDETNRDYMIKPFKLVPAGG